MGYHGVYVYIYIYILYITNSNCPVAFEIGNQGDFASHSLGVSYPSDRLLEDESSISPQIWLQSISTKASKIIRMGLSLVHIVYHRTLWQ